MIARVALFVALLCLPASAEEAARILYLGVENDSYYEPRPAYTGLSLKNRNRPLDGARLAFRDTRVLGRALGVTFELQEVIASAAELPAALNAARASRPLAILLDLPSDEMEAVLSARTQADVFINVRDRSNRWREADCLPGLLHTVPSEAMLSDALSQYLRAQGWEDILLLRGPTDNDAEQAKTIRASAEKFGLDIVDERAFEITNDPRRRDLSNIRLMTGGTYDVIWLIDSDGEFGRYVPFTTQEPRPVVGSEGLRPLAWHWTFERYGAPQLNQRFRRLADRDMTADDWAGWAAVRAVVDAVTTAGSADPAMVNAALVSGDLSVDLYKGARGNFRDWDGQMRQPILLATHNAVVAVSPIDGFQHQTNTLDTLGRDRLESRCRR